MTTRLKTAAGTGSSVVVERCQVCDSPSLEPVLFLGFQPPVNQMRPVGTRPAEQSAYPTQLLHCPRCQLAQLGLIVDPNILFPPEYPYRSGTTKILAENFAELYRECRALLVPGPQDLVVDIGSNDGTLLRNFQAGGHRVLGIEPTQVGELARQRGIETTTAFFTPAVARETAAQYGQAAVITATNVFAHIEHIHDIVEAILTLLAPNGVFISESHYLLSLIEKLQYDTIYHEHLRYYSLRSIQYLLLMHGLEVFHAKRIPTHGGSIRVYAARIGGHRVQPSVASMLREEQSSGVDRSYLQNFRHRVVLSKLQIHALLCGIKERGHRICGIGAPSRASTLVNYVGLDDGILDAVMEVKDSLKVDKYLPGTVIPVEEESRLFQNQPEYALLLSWHIADELVGKLARKGFRGHYIVPLPIPRILPAG